MPRKDVGWTDKKGLADATKATGDQHVCKGMIPNAKKQVTRLTDDRQFWKSNY